MSQGNDTYSFAFNKRGISESQMENTNMQQSQTLHPSLDKRQRVNKSIFISSATAEAEKSILVGDQEIIYILKKEDLTSPSSAQNHPLQPLFISAFLSYAFPTFVYTPPSLQICWSFRVDGAHTGGRDTRITCLSPVAGGNNVWLLFMEALANMPVVVYLRGDRDAGDHRGLFISLFSWISRPDGSQEYPDNVVTWKWLMKQINDICMILDAPYRLLRCTWKSRLSSWTAE